MDCNNRYVILNHHSGEVRLFHKDLQHFPVFNPNLFSKKSKNNSNFKIRNYEKYYPFSYGRKEHCVASTFLPDSFTRNIRRMISEFNFEVLLKKRFEIKETYNTEIQYLKSILNSDLSNKLQELEHKTSSHQNSGSQTKKSIKILRKKLEKKVENFEHGEKGIRKEIRRLEDKCDKELARLDKSLPKLKIDFLLFSISNFGSYKIDLAMKYKFK